MDFIKSLDIDSSNLEIQDGGIKSASNWILSPLGNSREAEPGFDTVSINTFNDIGIGIITGSIDTGRHKVFFKYVKPTFSFIIKYDVITGESTYINTTDNLVPNTDYIIGTGYYN